MFKFFNKYWFFILLACVATLLGFLWFNKKAPEAPKVELPKKIEGFELIGQNIADTTTINIGPTQGYKKSLPLVVIERAEPLNTEGALQIAAYFGISSSPEIYNDAVTGQVLLWSVNEHSLNITNNINEINYGRDLAHYPSPLIGNFSDSNVLLQKTQGLFNLININLSNTKTEEQFLSSTGEQLKEGEEEAYKMISLKQTFEDLDVIQFTGQGSVATIWFDSVDRIVKFNSNNNIKSITKKGEGKSLKTVENIATELKLKGRILSVEGYHSPILPEDLVTINITQIKPAYFVPRTGQYAHPVFVLEGTADDLQNKPHNIKLILPAIKKEFYEE